MVLPKSQHNKSKLMGLKFMQNAETARKKVNKAKVEDLRLALEDDDRSDMTNEGEKEVNDAEG